MKAMIDPVCGMKVSPTALRAEGYDDIAFCAAMCRDAFLADPGRYVKLEPSSPATLESEANEPVDVDLEST